jgi:hypothetical protein
MLFQPRPITPVIIRVVPPPTEEVSVVHVLVDALGLVGLITLGALAAGFVLGVGLIWYKRWRERVAPDRIDTGTRLDLNARSDQTRETGANSAPQA